MNKLLGYIFKDSIIAPKIHCERTKVEALVVNVLGPYSLEIALKNLGNSYYSIATDASNKGNLKMFPMCVRYFNKSSNIDIKVQILLSLTSTKMLMKLL